MADAGPSVIVEIEPSPRTPENDVSSSTSPSTQSSSTGVADTFDCRICLQADKPSKLISPCACDGSLQYCHYKCLKSWVKESKKLKCEICGQAYNKEIRDKLAPTAARAERRDQEHRDAVLAAQIRVIADAQSDGGSYSADRCRLSLYVFVSLTVVYAILFVLKEDSLGPWAEKVLRVLSVVVPFYIIWRLILFLNRYRNEQV